MSVGCAFLALGILVCTEYNGLELLRDLELSTVTTELELKNLDLTLYNNADMITYDDDEWPMLKRLWVRERVYTCQDGFCKDEPHHTPSPPLQWSTPAPATLTHSSNAISDVGIILIVFGSAITSILLYCLTVCMEWQRRCGRFVRQKYRACRGLESESEDEDEEGNRSALENLGRDIRERMNTTPMRPCGSRHPSHSTPLGIGSTLPTLNEGEISSEHTRTALETPNSSHEIGFTDNNKK